MKVSRLGSVSFDCSGTATAKDVHRAVQEAYRLIHIPVLRIGDSGFSSTESKRLSTAVREILVRNRPGRDSEEQQAFRRNYDRLKNGVLQILRAGSDSGRSLLPNESEVTFDFPDVGEALDGLLSKIVVTTNTEGDLSLQEEGSGFQSLLALSLLEYLASANTKRGQNVLFLVEEPEAFLHPQFQRAVAKHLNRITTHAQAIVTTHSPTIIDSMGIHQIARLSKDPKGLRWKWEEATLSDVQAGRLERFCDAKNSELIFGSRIIFCEGPSDANVIRALISRISGFDQHLSNISVIDMSGKDSAQRFAGLALRFRVPCLFVFDKDLHSGDRNALRNLAKAFGKVLDMKYPRLDILRAEECKSFRAAREIREEANRILNDMPLFCLGSDIEGAVVTSIKKGQLIRALGPQGLAHFTQQTVDELLNLNGYDYYKRLFAAVGSKGWGNGKKSDDSCPKQHVLGQVVGDASAHLVRDSDLSALKKALQVFLNES